MQENINTSSEPVQAVNMSNNKGLNQTGTALSLAKQLLMECEGEGNVTIPRETLKIVLMEFIGSWKHQQVQVSANFPKVAK
jgi:hypothetical protein